MMNNYKIISIQEHPDLREAAANWFHEKWQIPLEAYRESMEECIKNRTPVPQWYVAVLESDFQLWSKYQSAENRKEHALAAEGYPGRIIGGLGVITNDFHERKDLTPNVCAVFVEEEFRSHGIAGSLLTHACREMQEKGIHTLYLVTDHTSFYERYGWEFLCMVQGEGEEELSRMYVHRMT